jgi:hypothetical protein
MARWKMFPKMYFLKSFFDQMNANGHQQAHFGVDPDYKYVYLGENFSLPASAFDNL